LDHAINDRAFRAFDIKSRAGVVDDDTTFETAFCNTTSDCDETEIALKSTVAKHRSRSSSEVHGGATTPCDTDALHDRPPIVRTGESKARTDTKAVDRGLPIRGSNKSNGLASE
jgi:hypothetical protein